MPIVDNTIFFVTVFWLKIWTKKNRGTEWSNKGLMAVSQNYKIVSYKVSCVVDLFFKSFKKTKAVRNFQIQNIDYADVF